jgi:ribosomal protein S18 acetylase RimI-like enzyme
MLRVYPDAFTSSYDDDAQKPLSWIEERLEPGARAPDDFVLGAFTPADALVGSIGFNAETRIKQRHKGFIFGMYVAPEYAGQGIGRALLERCVERARMRAGLEQINLTVTASNDRARRLYESAGFTTFGIEQNALKIGAAYFAKAHMVLRWSAAGVPDGGRATRSLSNGIPND